MRHLALLLLLALPLVAACSVTEPDADGGAGRHQTSFDGASVLTPTWRETVSGRALFAPTTFVDATGESYPRLGIQLQDARADRFVLLSIDTFDEARPAPGTYPVTADETGEPGALYLLLSHSQTSPLFTEFFEAESGIVEITASSAQRIEGRLAVTMRTSGYSPPGGHAVRVTGTFAATPGH